ncbi:2-hydroxyacid dehydrogenase [Shewanella sp. SR43-4]|jgi:D-lactate dehydrogenase|uniref:2-hydroxyacid dehydrogenase n=1 Tax=Shewanella vesiculosa TaxID=518738 RepID=A0ABV0FL92_9GAMM|nr:MULTISPECIES: 2-hydroxyacid dehydrogenase [Shewanella]NCQ44423.1 2-hydroxyacid dehydrogenase [Shewanella frigidimarina]MBB1318810.1 2-hydroxyacid dehydrogenase [Shewanella sp. SR43-4]MBB1389113.1 2-hydroxyacid dehydrogenase [Shewanella sp. SG44-6]MBB1475763.1 2-hydroxyacid dehydrogenase [Shewanella sp. SG41-3]NCO71619.1 2-hydroxyacid dehydrogenase [Shewanella vesiculosa]|tara:strand:- start:74 stop:1063 length:990 start_codon:yes stop_codon:yes gene_type:complete
MKIGFFSAKPYDIRHFTSINQTFKVDIEFFDYRLCMQNVKLAEGYEVVCAFVNDSLCEEVLVELAKGGTKIIAMRCAGFNNVDLVAAERLGMKVVNVPAYSPESVAEHSVALMLTLNRKIHKAYQRTRDANFALSGLVGFNMFGKTVGVIGTGKIGLATIKILLGFGCKVLAFDPYPNQAVIDLGVEYVSLETLYPQCDIISLHCPLTKDNHHLLNNVSFNQMKQGVMVINTSRGGLLDALDAMEALKDGKIGSLGLDVYENEKGLFFEDKSNEIIQDDIFRRLSACHNVIFTGHQAFLTEEALNSIASTTLTNVTQLITGQVCNNELF